MCGQGQEPAALKSGTPADCFFEPRPSQALSPATGFLLQQFLYPSIEFTGTKFFSLEKEERQRELLYLLLHPPIVPYPSSPH